MSDARTRSDGLICAYMLDAKGGGRPIEWDEIGAYRPGSGLLWLHLDYTGEGSRRWLDEDSGLDEITRAALLEQSPRPRAFASDKGLLLIVRGINISECAEAEDLVSMRCWIDSQRVITLRHRRNNAAKAMRELIERGRGPKRAGQFVAMLIDCILDGVGAVSDRLDDDVARLEDQVLSSENYQLRHAMADTRRRAIALRRHLAPERDVLSRLESERLGFLTEIDRAQLREAANRMTRILEDIESARDRAAVTQEEVGSRLAELTNKRLYMLSLVAAIFLPLGLITGLWGVNVGGVPWHGDAAGFVKMTAGLGVLLAIQLLLFRLLKWL